MQIKLLHLVHKCSLQLWGTGATLVVPFMFMWLTKSKRNKAIGRASVVPTFFGVNEPILFVHHSY